MEHDREQLKLIMGIEVEAGEWYSGNTHLDRGTYVGVSAVLENTQRQF